MNIRSQAGQSLVELLVGLGIISVMVGASSYALVTVLRSSNITEQNQSAGLIGNSLLESASTLAEADWNAIYGLEKTLSNHYFLVRSNTTTPTPVAGEESVLEQDIVYGLIGHWKLDESSGTSAYDSSGNGNTGTLTNIPDISSGLVGHWKFDEGSGSTVTDLSGNGNTGTLYNSPTRHTFENCKSGGCLGFNGIDEFAASASPDLDMSGDFSGSISVWFKAASLADQTLAVIGPAVALQSFSIFLYGNGKISVAYNGGYQWTSTNAVYVPGQWYHVVAVKTPGTIAATTKLYVNGVDIPGSGPGDTPNLVSDNVYIGQWTNSAYRFNGSMDDVRIYNRALASSEALRLYNMNNCRVGNCVVFDGTDDYVRVSDSSSFDLTDLTVYAWIKLNSSASYNRVISQQDANYWVLFILNNQLSTYLSFDGISAVSKGPLLNDNKWHQIAISRDTVNDLVTWWVDGVSVGTQSTSSNTAYALANDVFIGSYIGTAQFFPGLIDDVRVYNRALSAAEILQLYNSPVYSRYFYVDNVNRTVCGSGEVTTSPTSDCLGSSGVSEDPSTQKITAGTIWNFKGVNETLENSIFVTRWVNSVTEQSDWGGSDGVGGAVTELEDDYYEYSNISTTTSGSIKLIGF